LNEEEKKHGDLLYFCDVRWLSRGRMLDRLFELRTEVAGFLAEKKAKFPQFNDPAWICDLGFLADLSMHLNELNLRLQVRTLTSMHAHRMINRLSLQGKDLLVSDMMSAVTAFELKLRLWESQLRKEDLTHFSRLKSLNPTPSCVAGYVTVIGQLRDSFAQRFTDVRKHGATFQAFATPFSADVNASPSAMQLELIDLQCDATLKERFNNTTPAAFWREEILPSKRFPTLLENARQTLAVFGSTYCCEQLFSRMKLAKSKTRAQLSDAHLNATLLLSVSSLTPDVDKLCIEKQHQVSH
jgi:hypothetical protein